MPAALMSKNQVLGRLMNTFREHGYDGASLAALSKSTGLGRSSLYHHFPGGKDQMIAEVLAYLDAVLKQALYEPLAGDQPATEKLDAMVAVIEDFYDGGAQACILERLCASASRPAIGGPLRRSFDIWLTAFETLGVSAGLPRRLARTRAEDALAAVEGALVVTAGTGNKAVFARALDHIRATLLSAP
jgi:AcrR family transcriptional regulator